MRKTGGPEGRVTWRTRGLCELRICAYFHCVSSLAEETEEKIFMNRAVCVYFHVAEPRRRTSDFYYASTMILSFLLRPPAGRALTRQIDLSRRAAILNTWSEWERRSLPPLSQTFLTSVGPLPFFAPFASALTFDPSPAAFEQASPN